MPISDYGGTEMVIVDWAVAFLCSNGISSVVLLLILAAASLALIPLNEWLVLHRAAQQESSVEHLEALFALEDRRGAGRPRVRRLRGPR